MRQLAMKVTYGPRWLAWQLYSQIIRRFALRPRDARWYVGLAVVAIVGAYAGRWHWLFPALSWSFVTLVAVASQTLAFAQQILTEAHEEIVQGYEDRIEELSQEVRNAEYARDSSKETIEVAGEYIRILEKLNAHTDEELHHTRSLAERYERELSPGKPEESTPKKGRGKPRGSSWYPPEDKVDISRRYLGLRHFNKVPKKAAGQRAGAYYETIENWQEYKDALPEFEQRYGPL